MTSLKARVGIIHWASKEVYYFFRRVVTEIYCIKINHIWTQMNFNTALRRTSQKPKVSLCQEGEKCNEIAILRSFFKNFSLSELHAGSLFRTFNSYSISMEHIYPSYLLLSAVNSQPGWQAVSMIFDKWSCNFTAFFSFLKLTQNVYHVYVHSSLWWWTNAEP